jgi:hypothetical protein
MSSFRGSSHRWSRQDVYSGVARNQERIPRSRAIRRAARSDGAFLIPFPKRSALARWSQSRSSFVVRLARRVVPQIPVAFEVLLNGRVLPAMLSQQSLQRTP